MRTILIAVVFAGLADAGCIVAPSEQILARDVRDALPFLQGLDPATVIGFSPRPGVQRVLSARELILVAQKHGIDLSDTTVSSICVEREVRPISPEEMRVALLAAIGATEVELELMDFSREPYPPGRLEFRAANLGRPAGDNPEMPVIWRGALRYDRQSSMAVWAKVKVGVGCTLLVAAQDIPAGATIQADQIKEVHGREFPFRTSPAQFPEAIIGKITRQRVPAGQRFAPGALAEPLEISRGDTVRVMVVDGSATLSLDAIAQSSGKKGESILVHNPSSGKNFRAVIEEKGKATVHSSPRA